MMASSASSSDGSSGGAIEVFGGSGSISALFSSSDAGTSLEGVSSSVDSLVPSNGSRPAEEPIDVAVEQANAPAESGDVINIDVADEGEQANLPALQGYEWAPYEPRTHATRFRWRNDLGDLVERTKVFSDEVEDGFFQVKVYASNERQLAVLREIKCASTQIHPNTWASMQAFEVLCRAAGLTATMPLKVGFLFMGRTRVCSPFTLPRTRVLRPIFSRSQFPVGAGKDRLTPAERANLAVLKTLPDKIPPRPLIQCLRSPNLPRADDPAEEVEPLQSVQGGPSTAPSPTTNAPTGASGVVTRPRFVVIPLVTTVAATAADKGKKTKKDDSPAGRLSKRSKKAEASGSLATAFLGSEVRLDEEVSFHLGPRVKEMLKDMSEEEALRTVGELSLRLSVICTKFPRADRNKIDDLVKELAAAKVELQEVKASASDLKTQFDRLNVMKAEHAKCVDLLKAADDRAKEEQLKAKEAGDELHKLQ
ncbi:hypothetical protein DEO72_LG8g1265 [Vigna unguiculata]|uniref:Uncharacterized protein n=1 Tax=Vigna unguiculata TaxID=3917 RepID=A0A4D6MRJ0_VIGUN|nr:hypothetical protein DEO72_LG8g1265 [Vigna unguiculata]